MLKGTQQLATWGRRSPHPLVLLKLNSNEKYLAEILSKLASTPSSSS